MKPKNIIEAAIAAFVVCALIFTGSAVVGNASGQTARKRPIMNAGAPVNGTSEVQTLTVTNFASGTLSYTFQGAPGTIALSGTMANAAISAAASNSLVALRTIGPAGVAVVTTGTTNRALAITFGGNLQNLAVTNIAFTWSGTAGTIGLVETTPGVTATARRALKGETLIDTVNGDFYINKSGTVLAPTWTKVNP